jgi:hypothetical protein
MSTTVEQPPAGAPERASNFLDEEALARSAFKTPPPELVALAKEVLAQEVGTAAFSFAAPAQPPSSAARCMLPPPSSRCAPAAPPRQVLRSDRLAEDFEFSAPFIGPLNREEFK